MDSLGVQFSKIITARFERVIPDALDATLNDIFAQMNANSASGRAFNGQQYDNKYEKRQSNARKKRGLQTANVDLRFIKRGITQSRKIDQAYSHVKSAEIGFRDAEEAIIFNYHHTGTAKGGKIRKLFPELWQHVPQVIMDSMRARVERVLNGG